MCACSTCISKDASNHVAVSLAEFLFVSCSCLFRWCNCFDAICTLNVRLPAPVCVWLAQVQVWAFDGGGLRILPGITACEGLGPHRSEGKSCAKLSRCLYVSEAWRSSFACERFHHASAVGQTIGDIGAFSSCLRTPCANRGCVRGLAFSWPSFSIVAQWLRNRVHVIPRPFSASCRSSEAPAKRLKAWDRYTCRVCVRTFPARASRRRPQQALFSPRAPRAHQDKTVAKLTRHPKC